MNQELPKHTTMNGEATTADDPDRFLWYGICGMWTDDLSKITGGIPPTCPVCGSVGFQTTVREWEAGIKAYEKDHPGYSEHVASLKENCPKKKQ